MIEIYYNSPSAIGTGYSSGSIRLPNAKAVIMWLRDRVADGRPILITSIREI